MTFWAIVYLSAMMGMGEPEMAAFVDKDECLAAYTQGTPNLLKRAPDLLTTGGCIEITIKPAAKPEKTELSDSIAG